MVAKRYVEKENQIVLVCRSADCTLKGALETALEQLGRDGFREVVGGDLNPVFLYSEFDNAQGWSIYICAAAAGGE